MRTAFRSLLRLLLVLIHLSVVAGLGSGEYLYVRTKTDLFIVSEQFLIVDNDLSLIS